MRGTPQERFDAKVSPEPMSGCWLWTGAYGSMGYGKFGFQGKAVDAHRVSWILHKGPIPAAAHVLHACDNRACVSPAHLFLGTHQINMTDCVRKGRFAFKGPGDNSRLTPEVVREIKATAGWRLARGEAKRLCAHYGLSEGGLYKLRKGHRWAHANDLV